ncbi:aspartate aminotransferase [Leptospira perolatii]|uniref:Aminotransferase n=1 Tax=Leptospira perolatii TaxID=2023191 RepID=A0A2M9ZJM8_9LEPT|nr:aminotransferase class I/II-fold pyridoxal phosphate-dependent enzyme [Leptospira perolatii]PJZ69431.1 aspartate aminotransferase [Leptospira perolatii]PJZ72256.1 aspartate aminotransferase [Leptospira perolatii]
MQLREFFIEDRLERYRKKAACNLGESGIRNLTLKDLSESIGLDLNELGNLSLEDSENRGSYELRREVASLYSGASPDQVLITTGTGEALFISFAAILEKGDLVSLFWPAFQGLYEVPRFLGSRIQKVSLLSQLKSESNFCFGEYNTDMLFRNSPKLVIYNHPHNPTGIVPTAEDKKALLLHLKKFSGWILFDEHYRFLEGKEELGWSGWGTSERAICTGSVTKCFGVMGLRIGWLLAPKEVIEKSRSIKDYLTHTVSPISEYITLKLLRNRSFLQKKAQETIRTNIELFQEFWPSLPGIESFSRPKGGVVGFAKLAKKIRSSEYSDYLMENADVFVLPGSDFEEEGYLRIGFGEDTERFRSGLDRWKSLGSLITDLS